MIIVRLTEADRTQLEAFEIWTWRRMPKISLKDKITNTFLLEQMNEERNAMITIWQQKIQMIEACA